MHDRNLVSITREPRAHSFMNWDDLHIFHSIAKGGSLSAAGRELGCSQTTVGRRLQALEQAAETKLFNKTLVGHVLTDAGRSLLAIVEEMVDVSAAIERWRTTLEHNPDGVVRIAASTWTSVFLARHYHALSSEGARFGIEIATSYQDVNLARREADIAIQNKRPSEGRFVIRRLVDLAFAIYGQREYVSTRPTASAENLFGDCEWVGYTNDLRHLPSARWLSAQGVREYKLQCATGPLIHEGVRSGAGLGVLPCFVGDADAGLVRLSEPIDREESSLWLVIHEDMRQIPRVRAVADRLIALFEKHTRELSR